ncbi:MAG: ATP-binding protein, partial [Deltaproteobacteria bacterium]|nr:ATP-binding protein [Deltaproteobacteria bacterium]
RLPPLPTFYENRKKIFIEFFNLLFKEKKKLEDIYLPLVKELQESTEENERLFNFSIQFNFDTKSMADRGGSLIDHGNKGRFYRRTIESLYGELEHQKLPLKIENEDLSNPNKEIIWKFINDIEALFLKDEKGIDYKISTQLKEGYTEKDFYDWLYGMDYYSISYSIKFNGIELDNLSPGLKGVALLILFLELDKEDKRPILIDQPEENLDNRSIYQTLMRYFRDAKKRRQVIIVTHNPNLVVNTDSEQIIVANFDRSLGKQVSKISYVQGSLENTFKDDSTNSILEKQGIREHVCEILEGGKEAFEKREHKYGFRY